MPLRTGLDAQVGIAEETTYGTYVAAGRFLEFLTESINLSIDRNASAGRRAGQRVLRADHWKAGKRQAAGGLNFEIGNKGFGLILTKHLLGTVNTTADGTGKKHAGTIGDLFGKSLTVQIGRPDVSGTVQPFSYLGSKIASWQISNALDAYAELQLTFDIQDETTSQALASATAPAETELLHWAGATLTIGGSQVDVTDITFTGDNQLKPDRFFMRGSTLKKEPLEHAQRHYGGSVTAEFTDLTAYTRFVNGTTAALVATWVTTATYDTAKPFKLVITVPAARFDGDTPNTASEDVTMQPLPFVALDDGTASAPIQIDYYTSDTLP